MTLEEVKALLVENDISFELAEYRNEKDYFHHVMLFPYLKKAETCKVIAMVVRSYNGEKDIELQFNEYNGIFCLQELCFGSFCFEIFDIKKELLAEELINYIKQIKEGKFAVIVANNLKRKSLLWDAAFDLNEENDDCDKNVFLRTMRRIQKPKGFLAKLFQSELQYEIYDWNNYQCIVK